MGVTTILHGGNEKCTHNIGWKTLQKGAKGIDGRVI